MTNPYVRPPRATAEILEPNDTMPVKPMVADPLPANPLATSLRGGAITGVIARARTRAELSREALQIYKTAAIETMRAQADVLIQGRALQASAAKRVQFEAFLARNTEIVDRLVERLEVMVDTMKDGELEVIIAAEEEARVRIIDIQNRVASGRMDQAAGQRVIEVIDEHRLYKCREAMERAGEFLGELKKQLSMTIKQMEVDGQRFL